MDPLSSLELLRGWPHVELVCPQTRLLVVQPQIRLTHRIGAHLLPDPLILAVLVFDAAVSDRMHNMHALLAELARKCLRQLSNRSATGTVRSKLRAAS